MEENNDKKICPYCGSEINADAKKCRFCGNWINDEEIQCPYCAEKIKASAKKCRFCGEWLNKDESQQSVENSNDEAETSEEQSQSANSVNVTLVMIVVGAILLIFLLFMFICSLIIAPGCKSPTIQGKLKDYLSAKYSDIDEIVFDKDSVQKIQKLGRGYQCLINATFDENPTQIEYTYNKVSLNKYDLTAKFVLPNCSDSSIKKLLRDSIKDSGYYGIRGNTYVVTTSDERLVNYDSSSQEYKCSAETVITSNPGKAFILDGWSKEDVSRNIKCQVDYKSNFCKNGYTTCISVTDLYSCEYEDD